MSSRTWTLGLCAVLSMAGLCLAAESRSYAAGNYALTVDEAYGGPIKSVEGGAISAQVIEEAAGAEAFVRKQLGKVVFEPVSVKIGVNPQNPVLYQWISQTLAGAAIRHDLTVLEMDYQMKPLSERTFSGSRITAITFPELNGAAREEGLLTVTFAPELIREQPAGSAKAAVSAGRTQQTWRPSNYRIQIDGINTAKVGKIESFTITQTSTLDAVGGERDFQAQPGKLHIPNLVLTVPAAGAEDWMKWHRDFVIEGNNGQEKERSGVIELLSPDLKNVLARLTLAGIGVIKVESQKQEASSDQGSNKVVHLYVEKMDFKLEGPADGQATGTEAAPAGGEAATTPPAAQTTESAAQPIGAAAATARELRRPTLTRPRLPQ